MKIFKYITIINLCGVMLFMLVGFTKPEFTSAQSEIVIIVHKDNPIANMSKGSVKLYFLRKIKKRWPEIGKNIKPVINASASAIQSEFNSEVLGMTMDDVTRHFVEKQYQNAEAIPVKLTSDAEVIQYVSENEGAIGYVQKSSVKPSVKVVLNIN